MTQQKQNNSVERIMIKQKNEQGLCCFQGCNKVLKYGGNNARPVKEGQCCDGCNMAIVIVARIGQALNR